MKILMKSTMYILFGIGVYLAIGYWLHLVLFPESKPEINTYFKPGEEFYSKAEGFRQKVFEAGKWVSVLYFGD